MNLIPRPTVPLRASLAAASLLAFTSASVAQQTSTSRPATANDEDEGELITLSPFEVASDKSEGYLATSSLAGSRLNTSLKDISSPISVITPQFLADTGVTRVQDLLVYTTNTEVAGISGNFFGGSSASDTSFTQNQQLRPQNQTRVRGLFGADLTRDFWVTEIPMDAYNVSSVEIQRGPNSILYGLGSPAGIINYTLKTANASKNAYSVNARVDNHGTHRVSADINQVLLRDRLAVRINGMDEDRKFLQDGKYEESRRFTISPRWTPKLADSVYTQFTVNYENGRRRANPPALTPPLDYISTWYTRANKYTAPDEFAVLPDNVIDYFTAFNGGGPGWYDEHVVVFGDPHSNRVGGSGIANAIRQRGGDPFGTFHGVANPTDNATNPMHYLAQKAYYQNNPQALAIINAMESASGRTFSGFTGWQAAQVLDTGIFDYWKNELAGPNNTVWNDFDAINFSAVQTYLDNRAGIEFVYDKQTYKDGYNRLIDNPFRLTIDVNPYLRAVRELPYGSTGALQPAAPNPNYGRPYILSNPAAKLNRESRENIRGTIFYKLNLERELGQKNLLTRIIGEQTFTGLASRQRHHHYDETWEPYNIGLKFGEYTGTGLWGIHYLDSTLRPSNVNTAAGLGIGALTAYHEPPTNISVQLLDERVPRTVGQFATVEVDTLNAATDRKKLYTGGSDFKSLTQTQAFIWQSRFLDDTVVGLFGIRKDSFDKRIKGRLIRQAPDARDQPGAVEGRVDPTDPRWAYDPANDLSTKGTTRTYGVMVHSPEFINRRLPWGTTISVGFNDASNMNPSDVSFDVFRQQIPAQAGESKDYTVLINTLNDRLSLRATWYKTNQRYASINGAPGINDITSSLQRTLNGIMVEAAYTGNVRINTTPEFIVNKWFFGGNGASANFVPGTWTNADAATRAAMLSQPLQVRAAAATWGDPTTHRNPDGSVVSQPSISAEELLYRKAWFESRSDAEWQRPFGTQGATLFNAFQMRRVPNGAAGTGFQWQSTNVPSFKNTTDIESKGLELEATANLSRNWRVTLNATKSEAVNRNVLGESMTQYYEMMRAVAKDGFSFNDVRSAGDNWTNGTDYWHRTGFAQIDEWGDEGQSNNHQMFGEKWVVANGGFGIEERYLNSKAAEGRSIRELSKWSFNVISSYDFTSGRLKGFGIGGAVRYRDKQNLGFYPYYDVNSGVWLSDLDKPIFGPSEYNFDGWLSYRRKISNDIFMTVQLNLRNLFAKKELIPISANPDGSYGQYRLGPTFGWELSTTFDF